MKPNFLYYTFIIGIFASISFSGCQKTTDCIFRDKRLCDPDYKPNVTTGIIPFAPSRLEGYESKILLEEFTGFRCTNCPTATATAKALRENYPGRLTVVAIHCTQFFAAPLHNNPGEPFFRDFRTPEGEEYHDYFRPPGLPNGVINRKGRESTSTIAYQYWADALTPLMANTLAEAYISIDTLSVVENPTKSITAYLVVKPLKTSPGESYNINVGVMENGILEAQKDNGNVTIYDYVHDHVFRGNSNGTWGTLAYTDETELAQNEAIGFEITLDISDDWNLENCEIFAYITKESNREVVQVEERRLIPQ